MRRQLAVVTVAVVTASIALAAVATAAPISAVRTLASARASTAGLRPSSGPHATAQLSSVSCPASKRCVAVGHYLVGSTSHTLVESLRRATWKVTSSPSPGPVSALSGVSCVSVSFCVAVGSAGEAGKSRTLVESFNGHTWSVQVSPSPGATVNALSGVWCRTTASCTAVGASASSTQGFPIHTLVESFNGHTWSVQASPSPGTSINELLGVACPSARSCEAIGLTASNVTRTKTLIESFHGHTWSVEASPSPGAGGAGLAGVSCRSKASCVAVGYEQPSAASQLGHTLLESFNGHAWSLTVSPNPGAGSDFLQGISCISASTCVAVGHDAPVAGGPTKSLVETLQAGSWKAVTTPSPGTGNNFLVGASCFSAHFCVAVGWRTPLSDRPTKTLVETFNGHTWSLSASPSP